jgi:hypothetical protein
MSRTRAAFLMVALLVALVPSWAQAQAAHRAANAMYVELGGNGLWYSVNYERVVQPKVALRAGISYMSVGAASGTASASVSSMGFPLTMSYLAGGGSSKLEIGAGVLFEKFSGQASSGFGEKATGSGFYPVGTAIFGYRYMPVGGGFNFKLAFTPVYHPDLGFFPWGGLSFGFGF